MLFTNIKARLFSTAISLAILGFTLLPSGSRAFSSSAPQQNYTRDVIKDYPPLHPIEGAGVFLIKASGGSAVCTPASPEEARQYLDESAVVGLHQINHLGGGIEPEATGLHITLQATQQLEGFPQAKAAFIKAAANWEAVIQTPLTIIVNVDYGPTRFGQGAYPPDVLGSTSAQIVAARAITAMWHRRCWPERRLPRRRFCTTIFRSLVFPLISEQRHRWRRRRRRSGHLAC